jgi:type I restriction enzyme S subunit
VKQVIIGDCIDTVRSWNPAHVVPNQEIDYIDLSAVDNEQKSIISKQIIVGKSAPSRARQIIRTGDILVSTVRPYLNGVARVTKEFDNATASTGFCVLRPIPEKVDRSFLFHWVKSSDFVSDMVQKSTGASYPAISDRIIKSSRIPLPSLQEQRRIAAILDQADAIRRFRGKSIIRLAELEPAVFRDMFGDLVANDKGFRFGRVDELIAGFDTGKNLAPAPGEGSGINRVLKVSAVTSGRFDPKESKPLPDTYHPPVNHFVSLGDLLFSRANTSNLIGATALVDHPVENIVLPDKIWRFRWRRRSEAIFVHHLFQSASVRHEISRRASGTSGSMKNIAKEKVLSIRVGIPGENSRMEFERKAEAIGRMYADSLAALRKANALFATIQYRAFRGEL